MNTAKSDEMVQVKVTLKQRGRPDRDTIASMSRLVAEQGGWELVEGA